jgi:hypothetical protein
MAGSLRRLPAKLNPAALESRTRESLAGGGGVGAVETTSECPPLAEDYVGELLGTFPDRAPSACRAR